MPCYVPAYLLTAWNGVASKLVFLYTMELALFNCMRLEFLEYTPVHNGAEQRVYLHG